MVTSDEHALGTERSGNWAVREYRPGDSARLVSLFATTFQIPYSHAEWEWKYLRSPFTPCTLGVLAVSGEQAIGHWGGIQSRLKLGDRVVIAGLFTDLGVHPAWRRESIGILIAMYRELGRAHQLRVTSGEHPGVHIAYGCPLDRVARVTAVFLGLCDAAQFDLVFMRRRLNIAYSLARRGLPRQAATWVRTVAARAFRLRIRAYQPRTPRHPKISPIQSFGTEFDVLWDRVSSRFPACIVRDSAYLTWRYRQRPGVEYAAFRADLAGRLAGYVVVRTTQSTPDSERVGHIMDLFTESDPVVVRGLVRRALLHFARQGVDHAHCWLPKHCSDRLALAGLGFRQTADSMTVYAGPVVPPLEPGEFEQLGNWHFMFGDIDAL